MDEDADRRTVSADDITVTKRLDTNRFTNPAVILEITSAADRSTSVTITEPVPDSFAIENVGFHPEFGSEHWSIAEDQIEFNRTIDPGEEYTTVYGVRNVTDGSFRRFLDNETMVSTDNAVGTASEDGAADDVDDDPIEELLLEGDDETVRNVIAGEDDLLTEAEDADESETEDAGADTDESETEHTGADTDESETEHTGADTDESEAEHTEADTDESEAEHTETDIEEGETGEVTGEYRGLPDSVAGALAREIRDGSISEENERVLREAFAGSANPQRDVNLRIKQLQTQVADLAAYTDEFERFLDAYGTNDGSFGSLEESLSDVANRVTELEESLSDVGNQVTELEESLDAVDERVTEIEPTLEDTRDELDTRSGKIDALEDRIKYVEADVSDVLYLEEEVMDLEDRIETLSDLKTETLSDLEDRIETLSDLEERVETLSDLEERVETLDAEMEEMKRFRNQLSSTFGPDGDRIDERSDE